MLFLVKKFYITKTNSLCTWKQHNPRHLNEPVHNNLNPETKDTKINKQINFYIVIVESKQNNNQLKY